MRKRIFITEAAWIVMLVLACVFPILLIVLTVPIVVLTAYLFAKKIWANAVVLPLILVFLCVVSGGDMLVVLFSALCVLGVVGALWGLKWRSYLMGAAVASLLMIATVVTVPTFYYLDANKNTADFASDYVYEKVVSDNTFFVTDRFIFGVAEVNYLYFNEQDYTKLDKNDRGYKADVARVFAEKAWNWGANDMFYDLMKIASLGGILCYLITYLSTKNGGKLREKSFYEFEVNTEPIAFGDMRLNKKYILYVALPALAISLLGYIDPLKNIAAAISNAFITVPGSVAAFTLVYHTINRIKDKPRTRTVMLIFWWVLAALCLVFPLAMFVVSFLGIADAILNVRRLLDYALDGGVPRK